MNLLKRLWNEEAGQGMTEYGLIIALISIVAIVGLVFVGDQLKEIFFDITEKLGGTPDRT